MRNSLHSTARLRWLIAVGGLLWLSVMPLPAQVIPDSLGVSLSLPYIEIPIRLEAGQVMADTVIVPLELDNRWNEVGGLQVDIFFAGTGLSLDTIITTERTSGWRIDRVQLPERDISRLLLFDPAGSNISIGSGSIAELMVMINPEETLPDLTPIRIEAAAVSNPVGRALAVRTADGLLALGAAVELAGGEGEADHGETVVVPVEVSNTGPLTAIQFRLEWEARLLELVEVETTGRTSRFQLEWQVVEDSAIVSPGIRGAGAWIWLYGQSGRELEPGRGQILALTFKIAEKAYANYVPVEFLNVQVTDAGGCERMISRIIPAGVSIIPGYLDPPRNLTALSGQDGRVLLYWAPPAGEVVGEEALLLVDDDASQLGAPYVDVGGQMADDLTAAGYAFDYYIVATGSDGPKREALQQASCVIWVTGYEWGYYPTLTPTDQANLAAFLDQGGRVWLIGQDIIWDIGDDFMNTYFGTRTIAEDRGAPETLTGHAGSFLSGLEYSFAAPQSGEDYGDAITTNNPAAYGLVEGFTHFGAVVQERTAFWALEYGFILNRMERIEGIRRQLTAFGIETASLPGIGQVLVSEDSSRYAPRASSPIKAEVLAQGYSSVPDSLITLPAPDPLPKGRTLSLTGYNIYRDQELPVSRDSENQVASVAPDRLAFVDTAVNNGQEYTYAVMAQYQGQLESEPSNEVGATPASWVKFEVGKVAAMAGDRIAVPILVENDEPILGLRFEIREVPSGHLSNAQAVLGRHAPPDWIVSLERDTSSGSLSVVSFSPRLTTIAPGRGEVLQLLKDANAVEATTIRLEASDVVISDIHGDAYPTLTVDGSVDIDIPVVRLAISTGAPTEPGDTGYVSISMDNPRPVRAFQLVIRSTSDALQMVDIQGSSRLPSDAIIARTDLGNGAVRLITSSFSGVPIPAGRGSVAMIAYKVYPSAAEGLIGLDLEDVIISGEQGITLRQVTTPGSFPVGEVRAVFAPTRSEGEPGRSVTIPLGLASSEDLCGFEMTVDYDPRYLTFRSLEPLARIPNPEGLYAQVADETPGDIWSGGRVQLRYAPGDENPILAGTGPLLNLVYLLNSETPGDTTLRLSPGPVSALGCEERPVFAITQEGEIEIGRRFRETEHFSLDIEPTGVTHFIQIQRVTLGGVYLNSGDELAVIDTAGWIDPDGNIGSLVVGSGVIEPDGSVSITGIIGFGPDPISSVDTNQSEIHPGARTGSYIHFQAWDRETGREGRPGTDARYILGEGVWGENGGLTIAELVRVQEQAQPVPERLPDELEVEPNDPNPFSTETTIRFGLPKDTEVKVIIFDLMGRELITLHDGITSAGYHEVIWDGTDEEGETARDGMYFFQVRTSEETVTQKLVLMR